MHRRLPCVPYGSNRQPAKKSSFHYSVPQRHYAKCSARNQNDIIHEPTAGIRRGMPTRGRRPSAKTPSVSCSYCGMESPSHVTKSVAVRAAHTNMPTHIQSCWNILVGEMDARSNEKDATVSTSGRPYLEGGRYQACRPQQRRPLPPKRGVWGELALGLAPSPPADQAMPTNHQGRGQMISANVTQKHCYQTMFRTAASLCASSSISTVRVDTGNAHS